MGAEGPGAKFEPRILSQDHRKRSEGTGTDVATVNVLAVRGIQTCCFTSPSGALGARPIWQPWL